MSKAFNCRCGKTWYKCDIHKRNSQGEAGKSQSQPTDQGEAGGVNNQLYNINARLDKETGAKGKTRPKHGLEGAHADESHRKRPHVSVPSFRPSMLSAGLKRKFVHLCQDDI